MPATTSARTNRRSSISLRTIFFGTSAFAVPSLRACAACSACVLVVTQPDRPAGRGHRVRPTPVKTAALELGIEVVEPERLAPIADRLAAERADAFVVASYGKIVPRSILALAPIALNVHPSLLPLYRGATPLQTQLRDGVRESGVSIIAMDAGMDTGDVVLVERRAVGPHETFGDLHDRFADLGAAMLGRALAQLESGTLVRTPQTALGVAPRDVERTATHPLAPADFALDGVTSARAFVDRVRSLAPQPLARIALDGETVKVVAARLASDAERERIGGEGGGEWIATPVASGALASVRSDGTVLLERIIAPNRGPMDAAAFRRGVAVRRP